MHLYHLSSKTASHEVLYRCYPSSLRCHVHRGISSCRASQQLWVLEHGPIRGESFVTCGVVIFETKPFRSIYLLERLRSSCRWASTTRRPRNQRWSWCSSIQSNVRHAHSSHLVKKDWLAIANTRASAAAKLKAKAKRTKKQPTASQVAEKERKKQFKEGHKQYVATGKKIAVEAKKEAKENHTPYNANVNYHGPGYAQHGAKATKLSQKGWHDTKNLQQFKQADVSWVMGSWSREEGN